MIQFNLSRTLARDMAIHVRDDIDYISSADKNVGAMQWYGHRVTIARRKCVIAMEKESRYVMVFCGMTQTGFENFPDIFQDRLWREVVSICNGSGDEHLASISDIVLDESVEQVYQTGHDASVTAHINQVAQSLEAIVDYNGIPLPVSAGAAIEFGIQQNEMLRKRKGDKSYFNPVDVFRDYWLDLASKTQKSTSNGSVYRLSAAQQRVGAIQQRSISRDTSGDISRESVELDIKDINLPSNVVVVDFKKRRRQ